MCTKKSLQLYYSPYLQVLITLTIQTEFPIPGVYLRLIFFPENYSKHGAASSKNEINKNVHPCWKKLQKLF